MFILHIDGWIKFNAYLNFLTLSPDIFNDFFHFFSVTKKQNVNYLKTFNENWSNTSVSLLLNLIMANSECNAKLIVWSLLQGIYLHLDQIRPILLHKC